MSALPETDWEAQARREYDAAYVALMDALAASRAEFDRRRAKHAPQIEESTR